MVYRKGRSGTKSEFYCYDFVFKGRRYYGNTFETSIQRARDVELVKRRAVRDGLEEAVEDIAFCSREGREGPKKNLAAEYKELHVATKKAPEFYLNMLVRLERHFGETLLSEIDVHAVEEFITGLRATRKASTCNRYLSVGRHMWNKAQAWGYVRKGVNPWTQIQRGKEQGRERFLTNGEAGKLLEACSTWLRPIVIAALHTGARRGELLGLTWEDVDFEQRLLVFRNTKNGEDRDVPLNDTLVALLKSLGSRFAKGRVFHGNDGEVVDVEALRTAFRRAVAKAKLSKLRFHDLRHSAASFMVQSGVPQYEVQKVLGHKDPRMTQRYAHLAPEHLRGAVGALDKIDFTPPSDEQEAVEQ